MKVIIKQLTDAVTEFNRGQFLQATEDVELAVMRLEKLHNRNIGR